MAPRLPAIDLPGEEWRPIATYEGLYSVSSLGRIRNDKTRTLKVFNWNQRRYLYVTLYDPRRGTTTRETTHTYRVPTLVAAAFLGPRPTPKHEVNHIDCDRSNNAAANLEYTTRRGNEDHAVEHGLHPRGTRHHAAKLTEAQVREIFYAKGKYRDLARQYGVTSSIVSNIKNRKSWRHISMDEAA